MVTTPLGLLQLLLLVGAFIVTVMAGAGRAPLWPAVLLLVVSLVLVVFSPR